MRVFTPVEIAKHAANKYLGVLVAAKYARALNEFPGGSASRDKKLTTRSLEELAKGDIDYRVVPRPPPPKCRREPHRCGGARHRRARDRASAPPLREPARATWRRGRDREL